MPPHPEGVVIVRIPPILSPTGFSALSPTRTSITFIDADVKVAAEGRCIDDAVGDQVIRRGVFICCLKKNGADRAR